MFTKFITAFAITSIFKLNFGFVNVTGFYIKLGFK